MSSKPTQKPLNACFSSGPCPKRPGWSTKALDGYPAGRSHRSTIGKKKLSDSIEQTREMLSIPKDYRIGIFTGSDTGAFECAMWSMLGPKPIDVLVWERFSQGWAIDITQHLKLEARVMEAVYGEIPDLTQVNWDHDVVFVWNGTTSGARIPNGDWIPANRKGLSFCDATSALFAMEIPWDKIDVLSYSWQKCLGGEGGHGVLVLSPRAIERIESYEPAWPLPKLFRMKTKGKVDESIFEGNIINTPSMLAVEDYLDALAWARSIGGLSGLIKRSVDNLKIVEKWVAENGFAQLLALNPEVRSSTSVCFRIIDDRFNQLTTDDQKQRIKRIEKILSDEQVAYDINSYRDAPLGFRIWCGPTVEANDLRLVLQWLSWAYDEVMKA